MKPIKDAGIKVIVQVQFLDDVEVVLQAGADVIVGQVKPEARLRVFTLDAC